LLNGATWARIAPGGSLAGSVVVKVHGWRATHALVKSVPRGVPTLTLTSERDLRDAIASIFGFKRRHLSPRAVVSTANAYVNSFERLRPLTCGRCCIQRYEALASDDAMTRQLRTYAELLGWADVPERTLSFVLMSLHSWRSTREKSSTSRRGESFASSSDKGRLRLNRRWPAWRANLTATHREWLRDHGYLCKT